MSNENNVNIDMNDLINALNGQISSYNLELNIAKLYIAKLEKNLKELNESIAAPSTQPSDKDKVKN